MNERKQALDLVYSARTQDELAEGYAAWAASYDRETLEMGYALPFVIAAWIARYVKPDNDRCSTPAAAPGFQGRI